MGRAVWQRWAGVMACVMATACYESGTSTRGYVPKTQAVDLVQDALAAAEDARLEDAAQLLEKAIEVDPEYAIPYRDLALVRAELGHMGEALRRIDQAIARSEAPGEALLAKGIFLERSGETAQAREAYAAASEILENQPADPADDLKRRLAWVHAEYLRAGKPAGLRAVNAVRMDYPNHPVVELYRSRIRKDWRTSFLQVGPPSEQTSQTTGNQEGE